MALTQQGGGRSTGKLRPASRGMQCHTCKAYKNQLFTTDPYGKPMCADCAKDAGRPIG